MLRYGAFLACCLLLGACAPTVHAEWHRLDGMPPTQPDLQQSFLTCRGQAAATAANSPQAVYPNIYLLAAAQNQRNQTMDDVMQGCMSQHGYVLVQVPNTPPPATTPVDPGPVAATPATVTQPTTFAPGPPTQ